LFLKSKKQTLFPVGGRGHLLCFLLELGVRGVPSRKHGERGT